MFRLTQPRLFTAMLVCHLATFYWFFNFLTLSSFAIVFGIYFLYASIGVSCVWHRYLTHRAYQCPRWFEMLGTAFAHMGFIGSSLSWCAAHRLHHAKSDKAGDPHSPITMGYIRAQWLSMFSEIDIKRSPVLKDKVHVWLHRNYFLPHLIYTLILFALGGFEALCTFYLVPACFLWNGGSMINTICHTPALGYRNYNTADTSCNNIILGYIMWGEGWHNNHHKNQMAASIGNKWWELDVSYWIILLVGKPRGNK